MGRRLISAFTAFAMAVAGLPFASTPAAAVSADLVISQVYGGGGNTGAPFTNDYIVIFNRGTSTVSLSGYSLQYASATGTGAFGANTGQITELPGGALAPGQYWLVQEASNGAIGSPLPAPDLVDVTPINMSATGGKVALVTGTASLGCNGGSTPCDAAALARIVDLVGYGIANFSEGAPTAALSNTTAAIRRNEGCTDTDDNAADFVVAVPAPLNALSPLHSCLADDPPAVLSTFPANGSVGVAVNTTLSVTFTEPVNVSGTWATLSCSTSGAHTYAQSGGPTTFSLNPDADFAGSETCTLAVFGAQVSDQDANDPPDNMPGDHVVSFSTAEAITCADPTTPIHAVQGSGPTSPLVGTSASVHGVVTGDYQGAGGFSGFYLQERDADADADPATSEGLFVFSTLATSPGDFVRVTGTVTEFSGLTELASVTRLLICSTGNAVTPTAVALPVASYDDFERYEGMLVSFPQTLTATETFTLARFGEVRLAADGRLYAPTAVTSPGAPAIALENLNQRRSFVLDDGNNQQNIDPTIIPIGGLSAANTLRSGYTTTGLTGVFDYRFNTYRLQPVGPVAFTASNPRTPAPDPVGGNTRVASMNVLNYFNGDGLGGGFPTERGATTLFEFQRQRAKMLSELIALNADVAGLMEVENDSGPNSALADIVNGLNAAFGAGTYAYIDTGVIGGDVIRSAIIYKPSVVTPLGPWRILTEAVDPRFKDRGNRPTLAQTFVRNSQSERFTVVVNHLRSKGSSCDSATSPFNDPDTGDGQGNCNLTRTNAAAAIIDWLATDPTASGSPNFLLIGDMNAYAFEDPITRFVGGGYVNLVSLFDGPSAYSYVFGGESGYLDHALASPTLAAHATGVTHWHINADEPVALDYNTEFKTANQINIFYAPDAYRASDHDPVIIGLDLVTPAPVFTHVPADLTVGTGPSATSCAALVTDGQLGTATASGAEPITITRSGVPTGNTFPFGTTVITYTATDANGKTATATQNVTVVDTTPPTITAPANVARAATGVTTLITDAELGTATASDNCGGVTVTRTGVPAGNLFPHGTTLITYTATDAAGNIATATQTVFVSATTASVCAVARSYIANGSVADSICAKLDAAAAASARGNATAHDLVVEAFVREVNALRHVWLSDAQADSLIALAGGL